MLRKYQEFQDELEAKEDESEDGLEKKKVNIVSERARESHLKKWIRLLCSWEFLMEFLILVIHPLPYVEYEYPNKIINMLGAKDQLVVVNYMLSDFLFAWMFMRFYFLIRTLMNFNVYSELYSKRICAKYKFEADTSFCIKALIKKQPGITIVLTAGISTLWLSYLLRIFERIYYESQGQKVFDSYITAIWCVIITMTTVGYGDVYAVSPYGRSISIMNALWGAFIISLLVASIGRIFELNDNQKKAVADITNSKRAGALVRAGIQLFNARKDYKNNRNKAIVNDYVYTPEEIAALKEEVERTSELHKAEKKENDDLVPGESQDVVDVEIIKEQIIDLNDKFDYLITLLLQDQQIAVSRDENDLADFSLSQAKDTVMDSKALKLVVKEFEEKAKQVTGQDRVKFRKQPPMLPIIQRIKNIQKQDEMEN